VVFTANGREADQDPYYAHLYRVGLDGNGYTGVTPDGVHHTVQPSKTGAYFIDTASTPDRAPDVVLRDGTGALVMPLEKANISNRDRLEAAHTVHREGTRRQDGPLRPALSSDELRCLEEVSDHQQRVPRAADRQRG